MDKKSLVVIGLTTAMILTASSNAFADENVKNYYKNFVIEEMHDLTEEEKQEVAKEMIDREVERGNISKEDAETKYFALIQGDFSYL